MPPLSRDSLEKAAFVASCVVLAALYGYCARAFGWFPDDLLETVSEQGSPVATALFDEKPSFAAPRRHDREGVRILDTEAAEGGLTLIPSNWAELDWRPGLKLIDREGRTLHRWRIDPPRLFPSSYFGPLAGLMSFNHPHGSHLLPNGDVLVNIARVGTARLDACGRVEWRLAANSHHSVDGSGDGTFWLAARTEERASDPIIEQEGPVRHDRILRVDGDGEVLDSIRVFDVIEANEDLLGLHLRYQPDDTHLNDVEPLPAGTAGEYPLFEAGDLLVSLKHLNVVFVLDPETEEVRWSASEPFIQQHDPDFMGDGWIGVFDNREDGTERGTRLGGSRVVAFRPHTGAVEVVEPASPPGPLYTPNRGNWQPLPNGNLLLTESNAGRIVEITPEGRAVWAWVHPPYDSAHVPRVYGAERYDLTPEEVAAWPCSPGETTDGSSGPR